MIEKVKNHWKNVTVIIREELKHRKGNDMQMSTVKVREALRTNRELQKHIWKNAKKNKSRIRDKHGGN